MGLFKRPDGTVYIGPDTEPTTKSELSEVFNDEQRPAPRSS